MKVTVDDAIHVKLQGRELALALRTSLTIGREDILSVGYYDSLRPWTNWSLRLPGSYLPGVICAGSYLTPAGWDFVYVNKPEGFISVLFSNVLVIETRNARYRRVILSMNPKEAQSIIKQIT